MREQKYRAWDGHEMHYNVVPLFGNEHQAPAIIECHPFAAFRMKTVEALLEYTGFKDKNDKEIYFDCDIVEYKYEDGEGCIHKVTGTVTLDLQFTLSICVKTEGGALYHFTASELCNIEVIGDIFKGMREEVQNG